MNPYKLSQVYKQLTSQNSILKKFLKLGTKDIKQPDLPAFVETKNAVNRFIKDNPRPDQISRKDMAGGGMLVQPSADGSRPGYKDERRVLGDPITIDGKQYKKVIEGPDKGKYVIREGQNNPRQFVNKSEIKKTVKANMEKGKQNLKEMYAQRNVLNQRTLANKNKWIKNWLNKNLNKYNVREFNNFQNDLLNDFNAEVKKNPNKYGTSRKDFSLIKDNFPIYGDPQIGGEIYDGVTFTRAGDRNQLLSYQKIFFKNKLKDKDFKAKINSYLDWNLTRKVEGGAGSMTKTAALDYGKFKKGFDDDVIYFMGEVLNNRALNPGGRQIGINDIFKKSIGKKADAYFKKYQGSWTRWLNNFYEVASLAGLDKSQADALIQKQKNDSQKIMRLFNVEKLPPEFVVAQDHLFGLSEAKALGDPKIARQTLQALVATTKEQNRILGQEGFSGKRTALIKKFKNASLENKANIINQLNTLAEEYVPGRLKYDVKKDGSLKITNLQPETTLKAKTEAYKKVTKTFPEEIKKLLASMGRGSCAVEFGAKGNKEGGRIGYKVGTKGLDQCAEEGALLINSGMKNANSTQLKNFAAFANRARGLGRGLIKFGIIPEAMYVAADATIRLTMGDKPTEALLRASEYLLPGDQTKLAEMMEATRLMNPETAAIIGRSLDYKNQLAKIDSLTSQRDNLENLSGGGEFDYIGNLNQDVRNLDNQIKQATDALNTKFKMTDAELIYANRMQDEVDDIRKSRSLTTKLKSMFRDTGQDASDVETLGVPEVTQEQLNKRMADLLPRDLLLASEAEMLQAAKVAQAQGFKIPDDYYIQQQQDIKNMSLAELAAATSPEQVYGASATMGEPLNKGVVEKPQNVISDMEREITGQTNVANPFDLDLSMMGSGLRGFSAAKGGRASFESGTIPGGYTDDAYAYLREIDDEIFNSFKKYKAGGGKMKYGQYAYNAKREMFGPFGVGVGRLKRAGGGISKQAGVDSGVPPESGPNPQGLSYLMKRGKNR